MVFSDSPRPFMAFFRSSIDDFVAFLGFSTMDYLFVWTKISTRFGSRQPLTILEGVLGASGPIASRFSRLNWFFQDSVYHFLIIFLMVPRIAIVGILMMAIRVTHGFGCLVCTLVVHLITISLRSAVNAAPNVLGTSVRCDVSAGFPYDVTRCLIAQQA